MSAGDVTIVRAGRPTAGGREGRGRWIDAGVMRLGVFKQPQDAFTRSLTAFVRPVQGRGVDEHFGVFHVRAFCCEQADSY